MSSEDASTSYGRRRIATIVACTATAILATAVRFWCKLLLKNGITADDWWILAALITGLGAQAALIWDFLDGSGGKDAGELVADLMLSPSEENLQALRNYLVSVVVGFSLTYVVLFQIKIAICLLYRRIFSAPDLRRLSLYLMAISTAWFVATEVGNLAICLPIDLPEAGQPSGLDSGMCMDFRKFFLPTGIVEILIDAAILLLPVKLVFGLQMPTRTKVVVSGIFLLGGFALITAILRLYYTYSPNGAFGRFSEAEFWAEIHFAIAMLCACLPVYRPLLDMANKLLGKIFGYTPSAPSMFGRTSGSNESRHTYMSQASPEDAVPGRHYRQDSVASSVFPGQRNMSISKDPTLPLMASDMQWAYPGLMEDSRPLRTERSVSFSVPHPTYHRDVV